MSAHPTHCDPERLELFLNEQLSDEAETELDIHLETCGDCRQNLESLAADQSWWSEARQFLRLESSPPVYPTSPFEPLQDAPQAESGEEDAPSLDFLAPTDDPTKLGRLGPYEISGVIGYGGMGVVLKGFDAALNRYVAIKVLAPQLAAVGAARQRFAREARAAAAVNHEHVVAIHAVDSARGFPYFVMPLVRGESLQKRIDRTGPLELKEILRIGMQVASGLAAAHAQGLVHRDIKPGNILLEDGVERVMITDFGLARAVDDASMTVSGAIAGTPQYMAPEQARGESIDHRTDLFSLGSVLYAMCTGRSPFRAPTTMAVLRRICEEMPRPIRAVSPEIPRWLAEIVEKLLDKDPADRFQSSSEVAELLEQHLAHLQQPTVVPRPARLPRRRSQGSVTPRVRRRRVVAAVLLALVAGLAVTETVGITRMVRSVAAIFETATPETVTESKPRPAKAAEAPEPRVILVTPEMVQWDDGLDEEVDWLHGQIRGMSGSLDGPSGDAPAGTSSPQ